MPAGGGITFARDESSEPSHDPDDRSLHVYLAQYFQTNGKLVESAALDLLLSSPQPLLLSRQVIDAAGPSQGVITREMVESAVHELAVSGGRADHRRLSPSAEPPPAPSFEALADGFGMGSDGRGPLEGYRGLFQARYRSLARMLRGRPSLPGLRSVRELSRTEGSASVVGLVRDVRRTHEHHHLILTLEDETGSLDILVPQDLPAARTTILPDEVVGAHLQLGRGRARLPRATNLERPDIVTPHTPRRAATATRVLFLSDLHIGSRSFLTDAWGELVGFLHGSGPRPDVARTIRHVVVAGDLVDGIGIYPNQERDLAIGDVFEQYAELGRRLAELPGHLNIVVVPGNHDAVCPAEPQPALPPEVRKQLPTNVRSMGNPSTFALEGVLVSAYHGRSFDDLIPALPGASYSRPTDVMKRMLSMRHLAPIYGGRTPLAPSIRDGLVVDPQPDVLVTGHAHTYGVDRYRGVLLLNVSTWQAETEYQRMRNITPVPARAALVNLQDLSVDTLDFSRPRPTISGVTAAALS